mmetsp:Transcript_6174/g.16775  ORF Transcript_6174/g.16775 Transcript_6174/m.16775 type:complete len:242 (+) Transcript_6174:87-812(+)
MRIVSSIEGVSQLQASDFATAGLVDCVRPHGADAIPGHVCELVCPQVKPGERRIDREHACNVLRTLVADSVPAEVEVCDRPVHAERGGHGPSTLSAHLVAAEVDDGDGIVVLECLGEVRGAQSGDAVCKQVEVREARVGAEGSREALHSSVADARVLHVEALERGLEGRALRVRSAGGGRRHPPLKVGGQKLRARGTNRVGLEAERQDTGLPSTHTHASTRRRSARAGTRARARLTHARAP